ncbi:hypothetical protein CGLO_17086 [Colletotrichum gloeosporioides Cg-14]|uniref:Uncharacterized protein n=1 Tax=Colletotrichum gloeosporioides (strain Cg-14) TaxID=1237896 RepID=T0KXL5_COLGC|nr:hypothetical protein CGLO_17086 [Colletotrichum gloeosporioides Cg-14]
MTAALGPILGR